MTMTDKLCYIYIAAYKYMPVYNMVMSKVISNILQVAIVHIILSPLLDCQLFSFSFYFYPLLHIQLVDEFHCPISPMYNTWTVNKVHTYYALKYIVYKTKEPNTYTVQLTSKLILAYGEHSCVLQFLSWLESKHTCDMKWATHESNFVYCMRAIFRMLHASKNLCAARW